MNIPASGGTPHSSKLANNGGMACEIKYLISVAGEYGGSSSSGGFSVASSVSGSCCVKSACTDRSCASSVLVPDELHGVLASSASVLEEVGGRMVRRLCCRNLHGLSIYLVYILVYILCNYGQFLYSYNYILVYNYLWDCSVCLKLVNNYRIEL